jgi:hypothetical protein
VDVSTLLFVLFRRQRKRTHPSGLCALANNQAALSHVVVAPTCALPLQHAGSNTPPLSIPVQPNENDVAKCVGSAPASTGPEKINQEHYFSSVQEYFGKWRGAGGRCMGPEPWDDLLWSWMGAFIGILVAALLHYELLDPIVCCSPGCCACVVFSLSISPRSSIAAHTAPRIKYISWVASGPAPCCCTAPPRSVHLLLLLLLLLGVVVVVCQPVLRTQRRSEYLRERETGKRE